MKEEEKLQRLKCKHPSLKVTQLSVSGSLWQEYPAYHISDMENLLIEHHTIAPHNKLSKPNI